MAQFVNTHVIPAFTKAASFAAYSFALFSTGDASFARLTLHFKRYCFQTYLFKKQMAYYANGMKVYGVSGKDFAKVEIVFPGHEEQRAIANVLDAISTNIELLQDEVKAMEVEKKALMQLLLTGLVRVNT